MGINVLHRRESLILTAIDVINELGIQGLSIREVAKRQGISNSSIFGHFRSKNDLILAVLDHFTQYDSVVIQAIKLEGLKSKEAITYYVDLFVTYYENYPAITSIVQSYEDLRCEPEFTEKVKSIFFGRSDYLNQLVKEAQAVNEIRSDIDSMCIADIIMGSCRVICLKWRMENFGFKLRERVLYAIKAILDTFTPK